MFVENTAPFFAEFGESVVIDGTSVRGIFNNPSATAGGGIGMASTNPSLLMATSSVPAEPIGKTFQRSGVTWQIVDQEPDGTGMTLLILERAS